MGTYLKRFQTQSEYNTYINSDEAILPNVSVVNESDRAMFKPDMFNGFDYVDLGLPSGTLWAKCNIGATSETEPGYYFQWGDHDNMTSTDLNCNWQSYWFARQEIVEQKVANYVIIKYTDYDGLTVLEPQDDTATMLMGRYWHMPDVGAFQELAYYTTGEIVNQSGYNGLSLTSTINGNKLFFPFAGYRNGYSLSHTTDWAYYWTREVRNESSAWCGGLNNEQIEYNKLAAGTQIAYNIYNNRTSAIPVRGVIGPKVEYIEENY